MERIGMANRMKNFEYPNIPHVHTLSKHVLYKIKWQKIL
jgi:hypothetical protein